MRSGRRLERAWSAAGRWLASILAALTYRRQELIAVGLLAGAVLGGLAVEAWHGRAPALLDWLETEPPRLTAVRDPGPTRSVTAAPASAAPRPSRPVARSVSVREARVERRDAEPAPPSAERPMDLDRATAADLARLPGIGPKLAARILARREDLGGRFPSFDDFARTPGLGVRRTARLRPLTRVPAEAEARPGSDPAETPP